MSPRPGGRGLRKFFDRPIREPELSNGASVEDGKRYWRIFENSERYVVQMRQDFKVLYMSGYADNAIVHHRVLGKGINYLEKPFTVNTLTRKVRDVLGKNSKSTV